MEAGSSRLPPTGFLDAADDEQRRVLETIEGHGLLEVLGPFRPCVIGTYPIGLARAGSDIDVICEVDDRQAFVSALVSAFGGLPRFTMVGRDDTAPWRVVARFRAGGFPVEVYGEPTPVPAQRGYRHMVIERRLLLAGGEAFREAVARRRQSGEKTEAAFAQALGLPGDPYLALLGLEHHDEEQLAWLIRGLR